MRFVIFNMLLIFNLFALSVPAYFSADFTQKIHSENSVLTYKGKIYLNNKKIFWQYTYPNKKDIWITDRVYVYEPDLIQVTISKKPKLNIFSALKNAKNIKGHTYLAEINNKKIYFIYNKTLKKIWYKNRIGNKVEIDFYNISHKKLPAELFIPKYPKDVDIIYQG